MDKGDIQFIYISGKPDNMTRVAAEADAFRLRHLESGISIVSFHDSFPPLLGQQARCIKWNELLPYEEMFHIWSAAYDELNRLIPKLQWRARELVEINYHDAAYMLWQLKALPAVLALQQGPTCYLVPELWKKMESTVQRSKMGRDTVAVEGSNPWRIDLLAGALLRSAGRKLLLLPSAIARSGVVVVATRLTIRLSEGDGGKFARMLFVDPAQFTRRVSNWILHEFKIPTLISLIKRPLGMEKVTIPDLVEGPVVVMTVEDSGSWVNLRPGLRIAQEFAARNEPLLVISSADAVVSEFVKAGYAAVHVRGQLANPALFGSEYLRLRKELNRLPMGNGDEALCAISSWLQIYGLKLIARKQAVTRVLNEVGRKLTVSCLLTVYEVLPLSVIAGYWAGRREIPWIGFFPILVGDRPDAHHFPAPEHIVYGDQLRNIIVSDGNPQESVIITGSPTYDDFVARDSAADRAYCKATIPSIGSRKLVVVATEAFPDPLTEIGPVMDALATIDDIFVVLKVHPSDDGEFFERYVESLSNRDRIQVVQACDLGALLHTADLLICIISNIIISAAVLGTPTLVCDFSNKRRVLDFVAAGLCRGCFDPDSVRDLVTSMVFDEDEKRKSSEMLAVGARQFNGPCDGRSASRIVEHTLVRSREYLATQATRPIVPAC